MMSDHEREAVQKFLEHVIAHAEEDAKRVADFLTTRGVRPFKPGLPAGAPAQLQAQARQFLLNLACALQLAHWERIGLAQYMDDLPTSSEAVLAIDPRDDPAQGERIRRRVVAAWVRYFPPVAAGQDVFLCNLAGIQPGELLDQIAAMLWACRDMAEPKTD